MVLWFSLVIILSTFSVLYGLGQSIPAENFLGLGQTLLNTMTGLAPLILTIISGTMLPILAQKMVSFQYGNHLSVHEKCSHVVRLVLPGNIIIGFLVPLFVVIVVNEDCLKLWVEMWDACTCACSDDSNFDEEYGKYRPGCFINCPPICGFELCQLLTDLSDTGDLIITLLTHKEICSWGLSAYSRGHCSRVVINNLGNLLIQSTVSASHLATGWLTRCAGNPSLHFSSNHHESPCCCISPTFVDVIASR